MLRTIRSEKKTLSWTQNINRAVYPPKEITAKQSNVIPDSPLKSQHCEFLIKENLINLNDVYDATIIIYAPYANYSD